MQLEVGIAIAIGSFVIGYFTFRRNRDKDIEKDARNSAEIGVKLDHIGGGVDSMRLDLKANEYRIAEINDRVIRVEESGKQAHRRLDKIDDKERVK